MFLKCIQMTGFKSFPEKTQMHMNGSITGVVGPNGSGKSNVSDAVRWVLGEQSAKSLRGSVMQDVIFAGTQKRKPRSYCEVSLIFDNTKNRIGMDYTEIEVTRKLYRSGESDYYINGTKCRLKDILSMFRDTGIGKEGYSIIGQGRIDEILSEKSLDRRRVFEEASGIMKYRVRKEEAERKLEKTRINLIRVDDILGEQKTRIDPLRRQAENARRYLELSKKLKHLEVNLFLHNYDKGKEKINKLNESKKALEEERAQKQQVLKELSDRFLTEQEDAKRMEAAGDELAEKLSGSLAEIERVEGEIRLCDERLANIEKDNLRINQEILEAEQKAAAIAQNGIKNADRIKEIETQLLLQKNAEGEANKELLRLSDVFEDRVKIIENVQQQKVQTIEKMSDLKSEISALKEKQQNILSKTQETDARLFSTEQEKDKLKQGRRALEAELALAAQSGEKLRQAYNEKTALRQKAAEQASKLQSELQKARNEYAACASSLALLEDMENSFEGYFESVRKLMVSAKSNSDLSKRIIGTFADVIKVPREYEIAIETALGSALQNIVVNDELDAKHIISYLRTNDMGRVTFLPLGALKIKSMSGQERSVLGQPGVYGIASELISCGKGAQKASEFLLGRTVIVKDNDTAISVMRKSGFVFRAVTLEGDIYSPGGVITGGSIKRKASGLVGRDRRKQELKKRADELKQKAGQIEKDIEKNNKEQNSLADEIEKVRQDLQDKQIENATGKEKLESLILSIQEAAKSIDSLKQDSKRLEQEAAAIKKQMLEFSALQNDMQQSEQTKNEDYKRMEDEYNVNAQMIEDNKSRLHDAQLKTAELEREKESLIKDNERLEQEKADIEKAKATKKITLELNSQSSENLLSMKSEFFEIHKQKTDALEQEKARQADVLTKRDEIKDALSQRDKKLLQIRNEINEIAEKSMRVDFNIEKAQTGIEAEQNRLWDNYQLTYANALNEREEIDIKCAQQEADNTRRQIRYLGNVNPNAIEDYNELNERMQELIKQKDDLDKAELDLNKLIVSLLGEMRKTFKDSFEQINKYFNKTFKELFDGGRAELLLEDENNIMECGIEIVAEPPGKKLQKISLLSGGEKALTAISLLFALLKINPSPVCILDEIDAALDEANVYKFSEYLQKFAKNMQFIVITHRKPTMVICDSLYGFAMEEKGVSKLLSVLLD